MNKKNKSKIIILGLMCRLPYAGVVLQVLHYMVGLERLGFEAYYVEWHGMWVEDPVNQPEKGYPQRIVIGEVMKNYGFGDRWICKGDQVAPNHTFGGMTYKQLLKLYEEAEAIFNICGGHYINEEQLQCPRRVYVESDPGIPQISLYNGDETMWDIVNGHTHHFTFGENIYGEDCLLPVGEVNYKPTRQPIVLDFWNSNNTHLVEKSFTTIARWKKKKEKDIEYKGVLYRWNKDAEFEKFIRLPEESKQMLTLVLSQVSKEDKRRLEENGWKVTDAVKLSSSIDLYIAYIQGSLGEFTIAKDQYVRLKTGWFSDRSASYLSAGRPVITQDTRFDCVIPTGEGLFAFKTMDDILIAIDAISSNYKKHSKAALEIAHEYFDSNKVLGNILKEIDLA